MNGAELVKKNLETYGNYFNEERAIPSIYSGLKPSQEKILYGAKILGLKSSGKYRKAIILVGAAIANYKHGNASLEGAIVRAGQPFKMTYPILSLQGNKGGQSNLSAPHSGAAGLRYLEVRLTELGEQLLESIKEGTALMGRNFDNTADEPKHLFIPIPAFLLFNQKGIGVGTATSIPSFKKESVIETTLALIKNPSLSFEEIAALLKPYYVQEATVVNKSELATIYSHLPRDGKKGSIKFRATLKEVGNKLVISNFPYDASPTIVIEQIQRQLDKDRNSIFSSIIKAQDTSSLKDREEIVSMELILKPKTDIETLVNALCEFTSLQSYVSLNLIMLDKEGKVKEYNIKTALLEWIEICEEKLRLKTENSKRKVESELEIVLGLLKALDEIDEIIALIKSSESKATAQKLLINRGYSEFQSKAILDMKLSKLANLGYKELLIEKEAFESELFKLNEILTKKEVFIETMSNWIKEVGGKDQYKGNCKIVQSDLIKVQKAKAETFYLTIANQIAKLSSETPKSKNHVIGSPSNPIYLLSGSDVIPIKNMETVSFGEAFGVVKDKDVVHFSKDGYVKRTSSENLKTSRKAIATKMENVISAEELQDEFTITTSKNKKHKLKGSSIKLTARGTKGIRMIKLEEGEFIIKVEPSKK